MAVSTPERDRDAISVPIELAAPLKRRARRVTTKSVQHLRAQEQPDLSAYESDAVQVGSSQPAPSTRRSSTNKDLLVVEGRCCLVNQRQPKLSFSFCSSNYL